MVSLASAYDFTAVIDGFLAQKKLHGAHATLIHNTVRQRATEVLAVPPVRYMPAFKILDLLAAFVNIGAAIDEAAQLRAGEVQALLREGLSDGTALIRQFMLEAALEKARYEPMMLDHEAGTSHDRRLPLLKRRWEAMRAAHQEWAKLPEPWLARVDDAVTRALESRDFQDFRQGPLLQLFAEMLGVARTLHQNQASTLELIQDLSEQGKLWRSYVLKSKRFRERRAPAMDLAAMQPATYRIQ
jgi:hypothetical protein